MGSRPIMAGSGFRFLGGSNLFSRRWYGIAMLELSARWRVPQIFLVG